MLIIIQTKEGEEVAVNLNHIVSVRPEGRGASIMLSNGERFFIEAPPAKFANQVRQAASEYGKSIDPAKS